MSGNEHLDPQDTLPGEDEEAEADAPGNGTTPQVPDIKISFPKVHGKKGDTAPKIQGQDALEAMGRSADAIWSVNRISAPGWNKPCLTGNMPIKLTAADFEAGTLHERLGRGVYQITNGKRRYILELATLTPPKDYGTPDPDADEVQVWLPGPFGQPIQAKIPKAAAAAMLGGFGGMPMQTPWGWGAPQQPNVAESVAKAVAEAMKPLAELLAKKDAGADAKLALEVAKIQADSAREERRSQETIAREARLAHEADAKATQAAQTAFSTSQLEAQKEIARLNADAQKETARLNAEAVKEAKANDKSMLEQFMAFQQVMGGDKDEDEMDKFDKILRISDRILNRGAEKPLAAEIIAGLPSVLKELKGLVPAQPVAQPQQLTGGQQPAAQSGQPAQPVQNAPSPMATQFLNAIATANDAILRGFAAAKVFPVLKERTPLVVQWVATAEPAALMREVEALTKTAGIDDAAKGHLTKFLELGAGDGRVWIEEFFKLARAS